MPPEAEVVGGDVGDHGHVVVGHPDPAAQDAAPGRLQHGQLEAGLGQDPGGPARPDQSPSSTSSPSR